MRKLISSHYTYCRLQCEQCSSLRSLVTRLINWSSINHPTARFRVPKTPLYPYINIKITLLPKLHCTSHSSYIPISLNTESQNCLFQNKDTRSSFIHCIPTKNPIGIQAADPRGIFFLPRRRTGNTISSSKEQTANTPEPCTRNTPEKLIPGIGTAGREIGRAHV